MYYEKPVNLSLNYLFKKPVNSTQKLKNSEILNLFTTLNCKNKLVKSEKISTISHEKQNFIFSSDLSDQGLCEHYTDAKSLHDYVYCKKLKLTFYRSSDWNFKYDTLEFRTILFEKPSSKHRHLSYDTIDQIENNSPFKLEFFKLLETVNFHDPEVLLILKHGAKCTRFYAKNGDRFLDGPAYYEHSKEILPYFDSDKLTGPYTRKQLLEKFHYVTVGTVLPIKRPGKTDRYVIDHRKDLLDFEKQKHIHKMRLPSLREIILYINLDSVRSISVFDMQAYFRQIKTNPYNDGNSVLKKMDHREKHGDKTSSPEYYIDHYMQQGQFESPRDAQRISSAVAYVFNLVTRHNRPDLHTICIPYEDDFCLWHMTDQGQEAAALFEQFVTAAGFKVQQSKNIISEKIATWIGIEFNLIEKSIAPSKKRIKSIQTQVEKLIAERRISHKEVQSLNGKLASIGQICLLKGLMFQFRELDREILFENEEFTSLSDTHVNELRLIAEAVEAIGKDTIIKFSAVEAVVIRDNILFKSSLTKGYKIEKLSLLKSLGSRVADVTCVTDSTLVHAAGVIIFKNKGYLFEYDCGKHFPNFSVDKHETIVLVIAVILALSFTKGNGILSLTDNEVCRYICSKQNASSDFLRRLMAFYSKLILKNARYSTVIRISTDENYIVDGISRKKDMQHCYDLPVEWIDAKKVGKSIELLKFYCFDTSYAGTIESLVLEDSSFEHLDSFLSL